VIKNKCVVCGVVISRKATRCHTCASRYVVSTSKRVGRKKALRLWYESDIEDFKDFVRINGLEVCWK